MSNPIVLDTDAPTSPALIVGVGIAGPALAIALRNAGIDCAVYDASAAPRDLGGAFVNIAPNGLNVLEAMGLERRVEELGFVTNRLVFHDDQGRVQRELPVGGVTIPRGVLSRALREAATAVGVTFTFGKQLEWVQEREGMVTVAFTDGTADSTQLLVGADGVHSQVRRAVFPDSPKPTYTGVTNFAGTVQTDLPPTGTTMHVFFGCRASFGYAVRASGETYWFSNAPILDEPSPDDPAVVRGDAYREKLLEFHDGDPPEIMHILNGVDGRIGIYPIYELPRLATWHSRSVCLIGDAAHTLGPHIGQGASLALEDALVLAQCLREISVPARAFETFETVRRNRTQTRELARGKARQPGTSGAIGRKLRDWVVPRFLRRGPEATQSMYRYPVDWDGPIGVG